METENGFRITTYKTKDLGMPLLPQCYCTLRHPHPDAVDKTESRTV